MKQLKFNTNAKALLDKTKVSTIRKAYKIEEHYTQDAVGNELENHWILDKPCKYEVGEIVEVVWTGTLQELLKSREDILKEGKPDPFKFTNYILQTKIIGNAKITSIEKIEIKRLNVNVGRISGGYAINPLFIVTDRDISNNHSPFLKIAEKIRDEEGFNSLESMFAYFEEYVPEIKERPMPFWLIRFRWVKE